ncbi:MAG: hypothetical protein SCALA702_23400 [Melioribacteraceae bacterium]|nr:MAG: hypothetical protein SCALA702_23400 [Melioribacteraceae bacterium]
MKKAFFTTLILLTFTAMTFVSAQASFDPFWNQVNYKGAFGKTNWMKGWTALDHYGYLAENATSSNTVTVTDADINANDVVYWTADNTYIIDGFVYVEEGAVLNIQAGTVVKAAEGSAENASALIISRGAKIYAEGTADAPIIFTSVIDDVNDPTDITLPTSALWGGVIVLGAATVNTPDGISYIEGIPESPKSQFGGQDDDDNSGVLRYVSIRHGGSKLGTGDEINGLTMGAVGRGTTVEYIEVFNNDDDGYEWFGGTVNSKYLVSAFNADDAFDHDNGYRGKMQFLFAIQESAFGGSLGEHDGGTDPEDAEPFSYNHTYNATWLGSGVDGPYTNENAAFNIRDYWGGTYNNSIFGDYKDKAIKVEDLASGNDSRMRLEAGEIEFNNNIWFNFGAGNTLEAITSNAYEVAPLVAGNNTIEDPVLNGIARTPYTGDLDPRPEHDGPAYQNLADYPEGDMFYTRVNYKGAFGSTNWLKGWTALDHYGYLVDDATSANTVTVTDDDINAGDKVYWTADNTYMLDGFVYVEEGAELNIEAGTVIKAKEGAAENASALIISRGAKIYAEGTGVNPIIFTSEIDDVADPTDITLPTSALWGGLIILGDATVNTPDGISYIEGIPESPKSQFGGTNDYDNSGYLTYVSIRHGGSKLGTGDEINGLTMGAVGATTTIDYVEVFNNDDDGYEWFGGTVNSKHLVSAFNADDAFDHDNGYRGKMQFLFAIQESTFGGSLGEHDGGTDPEDAAPYSFNQTFNATWLGSGVSSAYTNENAAFNIRDYWGGVYSNSIFGDFKDKAIKVEDLTSGADTRERLEAGEIVFNNNIWFDFGAGNTLETITTNAYEVAPLAAGNNTIEDPALVSITRTPYTQTLDPTLPNTSPAWSGLTEIVTGVESISVDNELVPEDIVLEQNYPNPFNPTTTITFAIPEAANVKLSVYNILGQKVATLLNGHQAAGTVNVKWNAGNIASGLYIYRLEVGNNAVAKKMTLLK